ncbi:MAG: FGGY family carbohydrate kinase [Flavobacteriaceae bacterium]|nr:FGGY family carbohydrate kinase [Flavobacteriaceae bacterium]MDG2314044.1 FGGY family carbohydrate kinase [Flavobacteriaceae bacterium]
MNQQYYIGFDIGSSSVKVAIVNAITGENVLSIHEPKHEMSILSEQSDWAEQNPNDWWGHLCTGTKRVIRESKIDASKIGAVGISYQMHGLVVVDKEGEPLRNAIIWCDSRAVAIGNKAFQELSPERCTKSLLNSPANFTASKLKWVKDNEPGLFKKIDKFMLPGDFIAYKLTGKIATTKNGLSEGVFWDYESDTVADWLLTYFDFENQLVPDIVENFTPQGAVSKKASEETGLPAGIPITYRAGDQPNNALSLNIFNDGEVAATGGTSGVIYAVSNNKTSKEANRINHFAHVNYSKENPTIGKLLCINGAGIMYRWLRNQSSAESYETMNREASKVPIGSDGLVILPFGNGAERMLNNTNVGTQFCNINLNQHSKGHLYRAALEGIAFSFAYGMEIIENDDAKIKVIKAGNDNLFRAEIFSKTLATLIGYEIEIYNTTGAIGAARAAGLTDKNFERFGKNITDNDHVMTFKPIENNTSYLDAYTNWKKELYKQIKH